MLKCTHYSTTQLPSSLSESAAEARRSSAAASPPSLSPGRAAAPSPSSLRRQEPLGVATDEPPAHAVDEPLGVATDEPPAHATDVPHATFTVLPEAVTTLPPSARSCNAFENGWTLVRKFRPLLVRTTLPGASPAASIGGRAPT